MANPETYIQENEEKRRVMIDNSEQIPQANDFACAASSKLVF